MNQPIANPWSEVLGNPYQVNPTAEMVNGEQIISRRKALKGGSKQQVERRFISYDRSYVVAWIARKLIIPLGIHTNETKYNEFQKLISEAISKAKEQG